MRSIVLAGIATVAVLAAGAGCSKQDGGTIRIGSVGPMTGDQAKLGADQTQAIMLAIDQANAAGDIIPGYRLEVSVLDDQHDPAQAVSAAKKFASDARVLAVVGHVNSSCSKPAAAIYDEAGLVQVSPSSTNPEISRQGYRTFFRTCSTDDVQGPAAAVYAVAELQSGKIYVIDDKTTYGKGLADEFSERARKLSATILGHDSITQGDKDFTPLLTKIRASSPDLIYFGGMYPEGALLLRQARGLGMKMTFMGGDGLKPDDFIKLAGKAADGALCTAIGSDLESLPSAEQFLEDYGAAYGAPGTFSAHSYDAARIIIEAIRRAGAPDRDAVLREVRATSGFEGVLGKTDFDLRGDTTNKLIGVYRVSGGTYQYLGPAF